MPKFVYPKPSRRSDFHTHLIESIHGDPEPLCDYLIYGSQPITQEKTQRIWLRSLTVSCLGAGADRADLSAQKFSSRMRELL